jgi:hypothetical protein
MTHSDKNKPTYPEKTLYKCHFVYHKYHMERPGVELRFPQRQIGDQPPEIWHDPQAKLKIGFKEVELKFADPGGCAI